MTEQARRLAVQCSDGCGFNGRRVYPANPKPCPKCGAPVDVGIPYKAARQNKNGSLGGHFELSWTRWEDWALCNGRPDCPAIGHIDGCRALSDGPHYVARGA